MSYILKPTKMKFKDPVSGNYVNINAVSSDAAKSVIEGWLRSNPGELVVTPLKAATAAAMTNTAAIYIYIGSESGYTYGNWYYHDGTAWMSGGPYNPVEIDTNLTNAGAAADAKATGDEIADLKSALDDVPHITNDISLTWEFGTIDSKNGTDGSGSVRNRIRTNNYITINNLTTITVGSGYECGVRIYNSTSPDGYDRGLVFTSDKIVLDDVTKYYRFILKKPDNSDLTLSEGINAVPTYKVYTDDQLVLAGIGADSLTVGKNLTGIKAPNLINNTLTPDVNNITNCPKIMEDGYMSVSNSDLYPADHGVELVANVPRRFGLMWESSNSANLSGLEAGMQYTISFDTEHRLFSTNDEKTRYLMVYYSDALDGETLPTIANVIANSATSKKPIDVIDVNGKNTVRTAHVDFTFTISNNATKFNIIIAGSSTTNSDYLIGNYIKVKNISLRKGSINGWYSPSFYDLSNQEPVNNIVNRNNVIDTTLKLQQLKRRTRTGGNSFGNIPLVLLHFSDIHGDAECLQNIVDFKNFYSNYIDDIVHTGDTVHYSSEDGIDFWNAVDGSEKILNAIGNHDTNSIIDNKSYWTALSMSDSYTTYFSPFISNWNVTSENGKTYYYKDYITNKVRLIVLDIMHQTAEQLSWFENVLSSAKTSDLHVIVANHSRTHWLFTPYNTTWDDKINNPNYNNGFPDGDTSSYSGISYPSNLSNDYADAVDDFIESGGEFVCWIHGHTHYKMFAKLSGHENQLNISVSNSGGANYARTYVWERVINTKSMDDFNVLAIDTTGKILRLMKIGVDYDRYMRHVNTISYNYGTRELIYSN